MENVRALYVLLLFAAFVIPMILFFCVCVYCGLATKNRKINQQNRILYAIGREDYFQYFPSEMNQSINLKDSQIRRTTSQCSHDKKKSHRHSSISTECMKTSQSQSPHKKHHHHKHELDIEKQQQESPQSKHPNDCPPV